MILRFLWRSYNQKDRGLNYKYDEYDRLKNMNKKIAIISTKNRKLEEYYDKKY